MPFFRSRPICVTWDRHFPRAASRCPWCKTPILIPATSHGPRALRGRAMRDQAWAPFDKGGRH
jgi:hypothetical protein